jgi:Lon protease-like protein
MVSDALDGDRMIGMMLLRRGWQGNYEGRPPVYPIGCSGVISHCERLGDGRFNIILRGIERFRLVSEDHTRSYRRGVVDRLAEPEPASHHRAGLHADRAKLESLLATDADGGLDPRSASAMSDADMVNALAQYLDLDPIEKQALLEQPTVVERARALVELLEMKSLLAKTPGGVSNIAH